MRNNLKLFIIVGTAILVIIVFIFIAFLGVRPATPPPTTSFLTPTPGFVEGELYITQILPLDTAKTYTPAQPIEISFNQSVHKLALKYETNPSADTFVTDSPNPNSLIIVPTTIWSIGPTSITILEETTSTDGRKLKNPQTHILNTAIPTVPQTLEGNY